MNLFLRTRSTGEVNMARFLGRLGVALGGMFWALALFGANTKASYSNIVYTLPEVERAVLYAATPLLITIVVFVLCFFFERLTAVLLAAVAVIMLAWGLLFNATAGVMVWLFAVSVLVVPTVISAFLFWLAAATQEDQEEQERATGSAAAV